VTQDELIGRSGNGSLFVDRWGPKWFDIVGMDRLRRRVVLAVGWSLRSDEQGDRTEQKLLQLARTPELRHLVSFDFDELTPTTAKALGGMRKLETLDISVERLTPDLRAALAELPQLRNLSISWERFGEQSDTANENNARVVDDCLAAVGNMTNLETLRLSGLPLHSGSLACLAGLKRLKALDVVFWHGDWKGTRLEQPVAEDSLRTIATLTQLEWLRLEDLRARNESLAYLARLTNLKTLSFFLLKMRDQPMLSHLPLLPRLEALGVYDDIEDDDMCRVAALPGLKSLYLGRTSSLTPVGLKSLRSLDSLEEMQLEYEMVPEEIEAIRALKRLKKLHLQWRLDGNVRLYDVVADKLTPVDENEFDAERVNAFRRAFAALRQSHPRLVIDAKDSWPMFERADLAVHHLFSRYERVFPELPAAWLPGGDLTWLTPKELAAFEQSGGGASFYGVTYRGITTEF
jgi:hypothetical protein